MEFDQLDHLTPEVLLQYAVESETLAEKFYRGVAQAMKDLSLRAAFTGFADEEKRHQLVFGDLRLDHAAPIVEPEQRRNLQLLHGYFRGRLFTPEQLKEKLRRVTDAETACDLAISMELDAMLFYGELRFYVPAVVQPLVDTVLAEERAHFQQLLKLRAAVTK